MGTVIDLSKCRNPDKIREAKPQVKTAMLVIERSLDGIKWEPIAPANIPEWLRNPEVVQSLVQGYAVQAEDTDFDQNQYRALKMPEVSVNDEQPLASA